LVERCKAAGIVLGVNQNMRYDSRSAPQNTCSTRRPRRSRIRVDRHAGGSALDALAEGLPSLSTFVMSIHHLDTFRYWLGTPDRVLASTRPDPRTKFPHRDGINLYVLEYDRGPRAAAWDDVWAGRSGRRGGLDLSIQWRIEGTLGVARG